MDRIEKTLASAENPNTAIAYRRDLADLADFQGGAIRLDSDSVVEFLDHLAYDRMLSIGTIKRKAAAISTAARAQGLPSPLQSHTVRTWFRGAARERGALVSGARPLELGELWAIVAALSATDSRSVRDRALLLLGFHGALRRSEIAQLSTEDLERRSDGRALLTIRRSKGDQGATGQSIPLFSRRVHCPLAALDRLFALYGPGPMFRSVNKSGRFGDSLSARSVDLIVRSRAASIGVEASAHSLRSGFCVSARQAGASSHSIQRVTRHKNLSTLHGYFARADLFDEDPLSGY